MTKRRSGYEMRKSPFDPNDLELFPTPPCAVRPLMPHLKEFGWTTADKILEPSVGLGSAADVLKEHFDRVECYDIKDYCGYPLDGLQDFLAAPDDFTDAPYSVQNPPYQLAMEFVIRTMALPSIRAAAFLLRTNFLEGNERYAKLFAETPPKYIIQFSGRVPFRANRVTEKEHGLHSMAWWYFQQDFDGEPRVRWIHGPLTQWARPNDRRYVYEPEGAYVNSFLTETETEGDPDYETG